MHHCLLISVQRAKHETKEAQALDPEILTALRDFAKFSAFKRAALEAIAFSMSAQVSGIS
jgi:hypothetical protein